MKKFKVIVWNNDNGGYIYRLDDPEEAKRFFKNVLDNAETDGRETFTVEEMTQEEWDECVKNGEEEA
jgi:hypothetical protein